MALHVIIGFDRQSSSAKSRCVYTGSSRQKAQAAMAADTQSVRWECFHNAASLRKNNPNFSPHLHERIVVDSDPVIPGSDLEAGSIPAPATNSSESSPATVVVADGAEIPAPGDSPPSPPPVTGSGRRPK